MIKLDNGSKKFYPPIIDRMPDFNGVAASSVAVAELPKDRLYASLYLSLKTAGTAMTIAQIGSMVDKIEVCADGVPVWDISAAQLVKLNLYYKLKQDAFADGTIEIPFVRPWHFESAQGQALGFGTKGLSSFTVKVYFNSTATTPSAVIHAKFYRFNEEPGNIVWVKEYQRQTTEGESEIDTLPKNGDLYALHLTPNTGTLNKIRLRVNALEYLNVTTDVLTSLIASRGERAPQSGTYHYDLLAANFPEERLPQQYYDTASGQVKTVDDIRFFITGSASATTKIIQEVFAPFRGFNSY